MMNSYDESRKAELLNVISDSGVNQISSAEIDSIIQLENDMTSSKDMLIELNENAIVEDAEFQDKIAKCFNVFLKNIVKQFGEEFCRSVYDYVPDEELGFLKGYESSQVAIKALEVSNVSSSLKDLMENYVDFTEGYDFRPMRGMVQVVSDTSREMLNEINEEYKVIAQIRKGILADIEIIEKNIIPSFTLAVEASQTGRDTLNSVNIVKSDLIAVNSKINKLVLD